MSKTNSKKKIGNITLLFNRHLHIFPDDFFITKNKNLLLKKSTYNEENAKNAQSNLDNIKDNINNNTTTNFRKSIKKISDLIKFDNIDKNNSNRFSFKEKDARSRFIKSKSLSDLDDEKNRDYMEPNQYLRKPISSRKNLNNNKKYYLSIYNNKFKNINTPSNGLFKESRLKYKNKLEIDNNYKNKNNSKKSFLNKKYINTESSKENKSYYYIKPKSPIYIIEKFKNKTKKIEKITNSNEININYPKIKQHTRNKQYTITEADNKKKLNNENNKLNKRPSSSNKQNIKTKIKNTIDNIFVELSKNNEDNQDILDKFNSLIRDVKNIQKVIKHKKACILKSNNKL